MFLKNHHEEISGYLFKKSSKRILWLKARDQKRFFRLKNGHLKLFHASEDEMASKTIHFASVTNVVFHYSTEAPKQSKQLGKEGLDHWRFDIYTPNRIYKLRAETVWEAEKYVEVMKEAQKQFFKAFN